MKNTAINTLNYTGVVTLSRYIGQKKVKIAQFNNTGAYSLFNFLSDCLIGDFDIAKLNRPTKIRLLMKYKDENGNEHYESKSGFIYLLSKPEKVYNNINGTVRYSFIVARDILEGNTFSSIGLYTNSASDSDLDVENYAAVCDLRLENISLASSSALLIDWELNISNKDKETV